MKNNSVQYKPVTIHPDFVRYNTDYEQYALLYSKELRSLFETFNYIEKEKQEKEETSSLAICKYVKIRHNDKVIYRKCRAECHIHAGEVGLGFRTQKELRIDPDNTEANSVCISKSNFLCFYLHNSDRYMALTAWIAVAGFLLTLLSAVLSVLSFVTQSLVSHCC